jgi:hypothetical protein
MSNPAQATTPPPLPSKAITPSACCANCGSAEVVVAEKLEVFHDPACLWPYGVTGYEQRSPPPGTTRIVTWKIALCSSCADTMLRNQASSKLKIGAGCFLPLSIVSAFAAFGTRAPWLIVGSVLSLIFCVAGLIYFSTQRLKPKTEPKAPRSTADLRNAAMRMATQIIKNRNDPKALSCIHGSFPLP